MGSADQDRTPLNSLDEWEAFLKQRYPEGSSATLTASPAKPSAGAEPNKKPEEFRDHGVDARATVREFYRLNHTYQTREFVQAKQREFAGRGRTRMGIWEAMEYLNTLVDDSDPDTDLPQIEHLLQTAEACRRDGRPRWFILTGLVHDLGKVLCLWGEPQWAVVGDTFPVGCAYSPRIVFHEFFSANPDSQVPEYQTKLGIYQEGCGLDKVDLSWGHDEYMYRVARDYVPAEAQYMIRYHSFYPAHTDGDYEYLMNDRDKTLFHWVREFQPYDLYSKSEERPDLEKLRPYYEELIADYFPPQIPW